MATDMQPFLTGPVHPAKHSTPDRQDRNGSVAQDSSDNRFESMLGAAQARRSQSRQELMAERPKQALHPPATSHAGTDSQTDRSARIHETARGERSVTRTERTGSEKVGSFEDGRDEEPAEDRDHPTASAGSSPDMLFAAQLTPQASTDQQAEAETTPSVDAAEAAAVTVEGVQSGTTLGRTALETPSASAPLQSASALHPDQASEQRPADGGVSADSKPTAGPTKASNSPDTKSDTPETVLPAEVKTQDSPSETSTAVTDGTPTETHLEPEKANSAVTMTASHMMAKPAAGPQAAEHSDLQSPFDVVMRASNMSAGQGTSSAEQFLSQDQPSSSESRSGSDHAKSNPLPSDDKTLRPQFLDQATGVSPSAPPSSDSRAGRGETGQATVVHVAESERIHELRGAFPSAQTVTLDLDPLDMGPLRVRIMMSEQTVHAHIRTEHGELGQSLLQQGQSLETSLRTTGLEMGMLRVTIDQQQQGRGENAWTFQQPQGRPALTSGGPAASGEDEGVLRAGQGLYNNGRVSFFA